MSNTPDEILESFGTSVSPVATFKGVRNPFVKPENMAVAKQQIQTLITEAYKKGYTDGGIAELTNPKEGEK